MCLFEFIRVQVGAKFMQHIEEGASYKRFGTSGLQGRMKTIRQDIRPPK
jgi:uncharacterized protein YktB (UPF0637 family)